MTDAPLSRGEEILRRRWLDATTFQDRFRMMPAMPTLPRLLETGPAGIAWIAGLDAWVVQGFRGVPPTDFEAFVAAYPPPAG